MLKSAYSHIQYLKMIGSQKMANEWSGHVGGVRSMGLVRIDSPSFGAIKLCRYWTVMTGQKYIIVNCF